MMVITELYIKNFGKFTEEHFRLYDGVQVIYGENEFGKSTIHAFIRAMLFGLERGRGKAAAKDDFTRYEPWDNPGSYAGVMRFVCGGRSFRLERRFDRGGKSASLVCEDDGEELSVEHGDLDMLLGGMTPALFDSTVSVGQLMAKPGQGLAESLKNYAANYYETGGEIDLNGALSEIHEKRKNVERQLREAVSEREKQRGRLLQECRYLEDDMDRLRKEYDRNSREWKQYKEEEKKREKAGQFSVDEEEPETEDAPEGNARSLLSAGAAGVLIGIIGAAWGAFMGGMNLTGPGLPFVVIAGIIFVIGLLLLGAGISSYIKERKEDSRKMRGSYAGKRAGVKPDEKKDDEQGEERSERSREEKARIRWEMDRIRAEWKEKEIRCSNLKEQYDEMGPGEEEKALEERKRVLELAEEQMKAAAREMGGQTAGLLNQRASDIFAELTDGRYRSMDVSEGNQISVWDGVRRIPAERLSRGTLEQVYFAVRMAAAEILQEEEMPLILDETFAFYDEKRLNCVLKWLSRQQRQVIILTCHKREEEILGKF